MNIRQGICKKLYISTKQELTLDKIDEALKHEWYAARSEGAIGYESDEPRLSYPFGGTLEEVGQWISELTDNVRCYFTWVPREFVVEHLLQNKSYPS